MEEEQVGLSELERNGEDPWKFGFGLRCKESDRIVGRAKQCLGRGVMADELLKRRDCCRARQSRRFSAGGRASRDQLCLCTLQWNEGGHELDKCKVIALESSIDG